LKPSNYRDVPYSDPTYGQQSDLEEVQNGESILFYANGLAIMGRSKVFFDTPEGFAETVHATGHFGLGWGGYFANDAAEIKLNERTLAYGRDRRKVTLQRKKAYFWSVIGDFTLGLRY
jgi:hypothetical protein